MTLVRRLAWSASLLSAGILVAGFGLGGWWWFTPIVLILPCLYWLGSFRRFRWAFDASLILAAVYAAAGFWLILPPAWPLAGFLLALAAWDLGRFAQRLRYFNEVTVQESLIRPHLARLGWVLAAGALFSTLALLLEIHFSLVLVLTLAILAVLGLSQALRFINRAAE